MRCLSDSPGKNLHHQFLVLLGERHKFRVTISAQIGASYVLDQTIWGLKMKLSARNVFGCTVTKIIKGAVNAEVDLTLKGGPTLVAVITNGSIDNLALAVGKEVFAIIKASSVIIGTDIHDAKVSARNVLCGTVSKIIEGPVSTEVNVDIGNGNTISSVITHESSKALGLKQGGHACALFKASSVILGVA
jgi:molybdate transport system regulatory protein